MKTKQSPGAPVKVSNIFKGKNIAIDRDGNIVIKRLPRDHKVKPRTKSDRLTSEAPVIELRKLKSHQHLKRGARLCDYLINNVSYRATKAFTLDEARQAIRTTQGILTGDPTKANLFETSIDPWGTMIRELALMGWINMPETIDPEGSLDDISF